MAVRSTLFGGDETHIVLIAVPTVSRSKPVKIDSVAHFFFSKDLLIRFDVRKDFSHCLPILWENIL